MMIVLTIINLFIFFSNAVLVGHIGKVTNNMEEKLDDMAMLEKRLQHYFESFDSALED